MRYWNVSHRSIVFLIFLCFSVSAIYSQPDDTVRVSVNTPQRTFSRYYHWQNAEYLWTVSGLGSFGRLAGGIELTADARFSLVTFAGLPEYPKLPLEDNGFAGSVFCSIAPATCRIYFATNARVDNGFLLEDMIISNAEQMKHYRFIPEPDQYTSTHRYTRIVKGNNVKAQFLYIDRLGEASNQYYLDNTGTFTVIIQRKSPELLIIQPQPYQILNDGPPNTIPSAVFREETLNFGQAPVGGGAGIEFWRILKNRGLDLLTIREILIVGADASEFQILRSDGKPLSEALQLARGRDSVTLRFRFEPTSPGIKQAEVLVLCNDPTQNPTTGGEFFFRFLLRGEGIQAKLTVPPLIDFGNVRVGQQKDTILIIQNSGNAPVEQLAYSLPQPPFFATDPVDTTQSPQPPSEFGIGALDTIRLVFRPFQKGRARDTVEIRGSNLATYTVILTGNGLLSAAKIWHRSAYQDSLRDTINYGQVAEGEKVARSFIIRNLGNIPLTIPEKVVPYYEFVDIIPGSKDEFIELFQFRCDTCFIDTLTPYLDKVYTILYDGSLAFPVGKKAARLRISVRERDDTSRVVATKEFILLAEKMPVQLQATPGTVNFDSVYRYRSSSPLQIRLSNVSKQHAIHIDTVILRGSSEFQLVQLPPAYFAPQDSHTFSVLYTPIDRGTDNGEVVCYYYSIINNVRRDDSVLIPLRGIGVEQQLFITSSFNMGVPPQFFTIRRGETVDTIDIGKVRVGQNKNIFVVIRNQGNIPYHRSAEYLYVLQEVTPNALQHYQVFTPHNESLAVGQSDTLHILYFPKSKGKHTIEYILSSNVKSRIPSAPDSVQQWRFVLTGEGIQAEVVWSDSLLDFQNVIVLQNCDRGIAERTIRLTNTGNAPLNVVIASIVPNNGVFLLTRQYDGATITSGNFLDIHIQFIPPSIGPHTAELVVLTDETFPYREYRIPLVGIGIPPPVIALSLPNMIRVRPGHHIAIPIRWYPEQYSDLIKTLDTIEFTLRFDRSLLEFRRYEVTGTVAENANIAVVQQYPPGTSDAIVHVQLQFPDPMVVRDTVIVLLFDTFLGVYPSTEIICNDTRTVLETCENAIELLGESSIVALDSLCGLQYKTLAPGTGRFRLLPVNAEQRTIQYEVPFRTNVTIQLYSSSGDKIWSVQQQPQHAGIYEVPIPELARGLYFVVLHSGIYTATQPLIYSTGER